MNEAVPKIQYHITLPATLDKDEYSIIVDVEQFGQTAHSEFVCAFDKTVPMRFKADAFLNTVKEAVELSIMHQHILLCSLLSGEDLSNLEGEGDVWD